MVEEVKFKEKDNKKKLLDNQVKGLLKFESSKYINYYYRAEGTFMFSLVSLILAIWFWDTPKDPLFFFIFTVIFNILLMIIFL